MVVGRRVQRSLESARSRVFETGFHNLRGRELTSSQGSSARDPPRRIATAIGTLDQPAGDRRSRPDFDRVRGYHRRFVGDDTRATTSRVISSGSRGRSSSRMMNPDGPGIRFRGFVYSIDSIERRRDRERGRCGRNVAEDAEGISLKD